MGTIIHFPDSLRLSRDTRTAAQAEGATVIILPAVRVERHPEQGADSGPTTTDTTPRRRGRRSYR